MKILTNENTSIELDLIGRKLTERIHFAVFDSRHIGQMDYQFNPLTFLEIFDGAGVLLDIGGFDLMVPSNWSIVIGDSSSGDLDVVPIEELNGRSFDAFAFNPLTGTVPEFLHIEVKEIYSNVSWTVPKLNYCEFLVTPLPGCLSNHSLLIIDETIQKKINEISLEDVI
jgi:hypothetical protein